MGDSSQHPPVNEAVSLLEIAAPDALQDLREKLPEIAHQLDSGVIAGEALPLGDEKARQYLIAHARVMLTTLEKVLPASEAALKHAAGRIEISRRLRLCGQIVAILASSGVLAAIGLTEIRVAAISAVLALVGSIAAIGAEYFEQAVDPRGGNLNSVYQEIASAHFRANMIRQTIDVYLKQKIVDAGLQEAIKEGNALCEEINKNIHQIIGAFKNVEGAAQSGFIRGKMAN